MSVVVECYTVLVRIATLIERYPGGPSAYAAACPNRTYRADDHLAAVGFMTEVEAELWLTRLRARGLVRRDRAGKCADLCLARGSGVCDPCDWIRMAEHPDGYRYAWLAGEEPGQLTAQVGWTPQDARDTRVYSDEEAERDIELEGTGVLVSRETGLGRQVRRRLGLVGGPRRDRTGDLTDCEVPNPARARSAAAARSNRLSVSAADVASGGDGG